MKQMSTTKTSQRYRQHAGHPVIEVAIDDARSLFNPLDPAPYKVRDLNASLERYLLSSARELSAFKRIQIQFQLADPETSEFNAEVITEAIRNHFRYELHLQRKEFLSLLKRGPLFLSVGLSILISSILFGKNVILPNSPELTQIVQEGIGILGWVSMWKPVELLLYDWYPLLERSKLYRKIDQAELIFLFSSGIRPLTRNRSRTSSKRQTVKSTSSLS